jgi:hypothetical protein
MDALGVNRIIMRGTISGSSAMIARFRMGAAELALRLADRRGVRRIARIIVALLVLGGCAGTFGGGQLAPRDTALEIGWGVVTALAACDTAGTVWASHGGAYDRQAAPGTHLAERDPVLSMIPGVGAHPAPSVLIGGNVVINGLNYLTTRAPVAPWLRWTWLALAGGLETFAAVSNSRYVGACGIAGQRAMPIAPRS